MGTEAATIAAAAAEEELMSDSTMAMSWLVVDEETASELSNLLDLFEAPPPPMRVRFIDDPYSTAVVFQSSSAYVTINGNEESCGSSFSDSDSSVMASVDVVAWRRSQGAWRFDSGEACQLWGEGNSGEGDDVDFLEFLTDGCDSVYDAGIDGGDAMLAEQESSGIL